MKNSMTLRHADAPIQKHIIEQINELLVGRHEETPEDGYDRVDYRLEIVLSPYDDDEPEDPGQPVRDLLTDVVHLCAAKGWDVREMLEEAFWMSRLERDEWGDR